MITSDHPTDEILTGDNTQHARLLDVRQYLYNEMATLEERERRMEIEEDKRFADRCRRSKCSVSMLRKIKRKETIRNRLLAEADHLSSCLKKYGVGDYCRDICSKVSQKIIDKWRKELEQYHSELTVIDEECQRLRDSVNERRRKANTKKC